EGQAAVSGVGELAGGFDDEEVVEDGRGFGAAAHGVEAGAVVAPGHQVQESGGLSGGVVADDDEAAGVAGVEEAGQGHGEAAFGGTAAPGGGDGGEFGGFGGGEVGGAVQAGGVAGAFGAVPALPGGADGAAGEGEAGEVEDGFVAEVHGVEAGVPVGGGGGFGGADDGGDEAGGGGGGAEGGGGAGPAVGGSGGV